MSCLSPFKSPHILKDSLDQYFLKDAMMFMPIFHAQLHVAAYVTSTSMHWCYLSRKIIIKKKTTMSQFLISDHLFPFEFHMFFYIRSSAVFFLMMFMCILVFLLIDIFFSSHER